MSESRSILRSSAMAAPRRWSSRPARIVWWCLPRFDGDPVFCRLIAGDEEKGFTDVVLDGQVESRSEYMRNTAIVVTELDRRQWRRRCASPISRRASTISAASSGRRSSMRIIEPIAGMPRITIRFRAAQRYGEPVTRALVGQQPHPLWRDEVPVRLTTDAPLSYIENEASSCSRGRCTW